MIKARGVFEGLVAGLAMGFFVALGERSTSFPHVYLDALTPFFRFLAPRIDPVALHRLDTNDATAAITIGSFALAGALLGALIRRGSLATLLLAGGAGAAFAAIWKHRLLPFVPGLVLVGLAALVAGAAALAVGLAFARLPARAGRLVLGFALTGVLVFPSLRIAQALRGPEHPASSPVAAAIRVPTNQKVAILAIDGLDGRVLDEAFREGRLPHLRALCDRGVRAPLRSIRPPRSPVVWTSVVTGALPHTHGIRDFVTRRQGERIPVTGDLRRIPALWDLGVHVGFTTAFVNWYASWPSDSVRGVQITDRADFGELERRTFPLELEAVVDSLRAALDHDPRGDARRFTEWGDRYDAWRAGLWGQNQRSMKILDDVIRHDLFSMECAKLALRGGQPELFAVYFRGTDNAQHLFWKYRLARTDPLAARALYAPIPEDEAQALAPVVDRYYDFVDELTGATLAMLEPDTAILVASDHGFLANNERGRWWNANALLEAADLPARDGDEPSIAPGRKIRGDRLEEARDALLQARTDRGERFVASAGFAQDEHGRYLEVGFDRTARGDSVRIATSSIPLRDVTLPEGHSGDHRMDGVLVAAGPPFRDRATAGIRGARAVDLGPTILHLLGAPVAEDQEGVALVGLFDPAWASRHALRAVETYGTRDVAATPSPTPADERIREELEALGYIR